MLPKVRFELAGPEFDAELIFSFLKTGETKWDWSEKIFQNHPDLKKELSELKKFSEQRKVVLSYVKEFWGSNIGQIELKKNLFAKDWKARNDEFMMVLSKILETSWTGKRKTIRAFISINPICPRFLKDWSFSIFYKDDVVEIRETIAHEVTHFLYFKKWKEVFPDAKEERFESPHLEWALSEILAPVILNDERIQRIIKKRARSYDEYESFKIGKKSIISHFADLYEYCMKNKDSFADFLKSAFQEIRKYEKETRQI